MYVIRMSQKWNGIDVAEMDWNGETLRAETRHGAIMAIARKAVGAGCPDAAWVGVDSLTGVERLHGTSLHALAPWTYTEARGRIQRVRWEPRPGLE